MKLVSVFMDVEDPVNELADDAAMDLAHLFTEEGIRGSFCLTGEKCRTLAARGRTDVIHAFKPHSLGLHTNTHSVHPTTMELLADCSFQQGCELAFASESQGAQAFEQAFGHKPHFWGGAGNTWSPEITDAMKRLAIPAYVYSLTSMPGQAVHRFNGVVALPQSVSISESDWPDDDRAARRTAAAFQEIQTVRAPWVGLFVGHPTKLRYTKFWDWPYMDGRQPELVATTEPVPAEDYHRALRNLRAFLVELKKEVNIVGVDTALQRPWKFRKPSPTEAEVFRVQSAAEVRSAKGWPIHRPDLDVGGIVAKTLDLADTAEIGELT
jgi:hypothetical protein